MDVSTWWIAGGSLLLLAVLTAGAWLVTVIVRRSNQKTAEVDTAPFDVPAEEGSGPDDDTAATDADADGDAGELGASGGGADAAEDLPTARLETTEDQTHRS